MNVVLKSGKRPEYGLYTVPLPIPDHLYEEVIQSLEIMGTGSPTARDCLVEELTGEYPVLKQLEGALINIEELDYLAKRLDSFDVGEAAQFQAMASKLNLTDMTDFINLTFCCQQATVITDFSSLEQVGKDHYLNTHGGCASIDKYNAVDGYETALLLIEGGGGVITPYGVVYDNGMKLEPVYDGLHFPEYLHDHSELMAWVTDDAGKETFLYLPMLEAKITRFLERSRLDGQEFRTDNLNLSVKVMGVIEHSECGLSALNMMCAAISGLDKEGRVKLDAIIDMARPEDPKEIARLIHNMEHFHFCPDVCDCDGLGRYLIQESGLYSFDGELEKYYDYESCGRDQMDSENGLFTAEGYIAYTGPMGLEELMTEKQTDQGIQMGGLGI